MRNAADDWLKMSYVSDRLKKDEEVARHALELGSEAKNKEPVITPTDTEALEEAREAISQLDDLDTEALRKLALDCMQNSPARTRALTPVLRVNNANAIRKVLGAITSGECAA